MTRRFLRTSMLVVGSTLAVAMSAPAVAVDQALPGTVGQVLPRWQPGMLDIHQIATGRGNAAFTMFPDGTTLLVDAGDAAAIPHADARPDDSRTPAEWISRYIRQMAGGAGARLDFAVITHFHPDHMGRSTPADPMSAIGGYRLRGITAVAEDVPIARLIDRGGDYLPPADDATMANYRRFVAAQAAAGRMTSVRADAGSATQIRQVRNPGAAPAFGVRIVAANDRVWTGQGDATKIRFPALDTIAVAEDRPTENMCSVTLRMEYGPFSYFTGGDMPGYPVPGGPAWHDLETDVARAIGRTDVHVVNHHGSIEVENPFWMSTLRSRVVVVPAWSPTHPSPDVLKRILSPRVYPEPRDVFVSAFRDPTKAAIGARATQVASDRGHIVIRVEPGGARYWVLILDDASESYKVTAVHGPYASE